MCNFSHAGRTQGDIFENNMNSQLTFKSYGKRGCLLCLTLKLSQRWQEGMQETDLTAKRIHLTGLQYRGVIVQGPSYDNLKFIAVFALRPSLPWISLSDGLRMTGVQRQAFLGDT